MEISVTEIPAPLCHVHISRLARTDTEAIADILHVLIQTVFVWRITERNTNIRACRVVEIGVTRHQYLFSLILIPLGFDPLQRSVCIKETLGDGKVHGVKLVLMSRAQRRGLRAVKGVLDRKLNGFQIFHVAGQRTLGVGIRPVALGKARKDIRSANAVLGSGG